LLQIIQYGTIHIKNFRYEANTYLTLE